ncbi:MAG: polyphosphate kinase 1 [Methanocorpusculum sp.]|jgi:polyphosphate kinase|nr:polyphosphate kinase 1 [Methanocorpusculum sp.]
MGSIHKPGKTRKNRYVRKATRFPKESGRYFNRELSWLKFNERVLFEAENTDNPLLERVTFLGIVAGNLDEFFMVRVPAYQKGATYSADEFSEVIGSSTQLEMIYSRVIVLMRHMAEVWNNDLVPKLAAEGIFFLRYAECTDEEKKAFKKELEEESFTILRGDRFSDIQHDEYLHGFAMLVQTDKGRAVIPVQRIIDEKGRFVPVGDRKNTFIFREDLLKKHILSLFPDETVYAVMPVRLTRDSDLDLKGDDADDLISAIMDAQKTLAKRYPSRLETLDTMPFGYMAPLVDALSLVPELVYDMAAPLGLIDLKEFPVKRPNLKFPPYTASLPSGLSGNVFSAIAKRDRFMFNPYNSFDGLIRFMSAAADDPTVVKIQITLYRLGSESPVIDALLAAAKNRKDVTAVVELKASFDEETNFRWATKLKEGGVNVIMGYPGVKVHAKCCLITRIENGQIVRYANISTGNYNANTAKIYADMAIFTANEEICTDAAAMFAMLAGTFSSPVYRRLIISPNSMDQEIIRRIEREAEISGTNGRIIMKMNSLTDRDIINALYAASEKGVRVDLAVRGVCMLRPGVEKLSETISVISVVSRFLEHARVYYFENGGDPEVFIGSPDMMPRNLHRRIEILCPILDKRIKKVLIQKILPAFIDDPVKGHTLDAYGRYHPPERRPGELSSQQKFIAMQRAWR